MKVYSWKNLLITIFGAGGGLAYAVYDLCHGASALHAAWVVIFGAWIVRGLRASLTEEGYAKDVENGERGKRIYRKLFGKFAPIMPWGMLIIFGAAWIFSRVFPDRPWVVLCLVFAALGYEIWLAAVVKREVKREEAQQEA